jgi:hypothetical protein
MWMLSCGLDLVRPRLQWGVLHDQLAAFMEVLSWQEAGGKAGAGYAAEYGVAGGGWEGGEYGSCRGLLWV